MFEKQTILLATHNTNKTKEYRELLNGYPYEIIDLNDIDFHLPIDEKYDTYHENARVKVEAVAKVYNGIIVGDDSGFEIAALDYQPGVHSARFLSHLSYPEKNDYIIKELEKHQDRSCAFVCALACFYDEKIWITVNRCFGEVAKKREEGHGFGFDPIFVPLGYTQPFSVLDPAIKNKISHRALAVQALIHYLENLP
ncbi:MAG: non-canonical purine NTP pyrophosphatase [Erysipelothrix sp.]|jgi:XTP/dITP diphosphohydrolase|nr:non-canonical purine NTP pyrophosphatase [Erysipelothrix sp.]